MFQNPWVVTYAFLQGVIGDLIGYDPSSGEAGVLKAVYTALFVVGSPAPGNGSTLATQTEATYDGYVRQPIVWFPTDFNPLGQQEIIAANQQFRPTDATVPNTITQIGIVSALTGGSLLLLAALANPVNLNNPTTMLTVANVFQLSYAGAFGGALAYT